MNMELQKNLEKLERLGADLSKLHFRIKRTMLEISSMAGGNGEHVDVIDHHVYNATRRLSLIIDEYTA